MDHIINGKKAKKSHKKSFLTDAVVDKFRKDVKIDSIIVIGTREGLGTEASIKIEGTTDALSCIKMIDEIRSSLIKNVATQLQDIISNKK